MRPSKASLSSLMYAVCMENFQPGDLVVLRSGGPDMVVESTGKISSDSPGLAGRIQVFCVWFDASRVVRDSFVAEALKRKEYRPQGGSTGMPGLG